MHNRYFGFSGEPFALLPDPSMILLTRDHILAVDSLVDGIKQRKDFMLLTGERGIGKTTLIHHFLTLLGGNIKAVPVFQNYATTEDLLAYVLHQLRLPSGGGNRSFMITQLEEHVLQRSAMEETLILIIDEAQSLDRQVLEDLRLLVTPDPRRQKNFHEILVADSGFEEMLNTRHLTQLTQRIGVRCVLRPLGADECRQYLDHRLRKVGANLEDVFTPEAADFICAAGRGVPRTINALCYLGLSAGYTLSQKRIDVPLLAKVLPLVGEQGSVLPLPFGSAMAAPPAPGERASPNIFGRLAGNSGITKASYALLAYSLVLWIVFFFLNLARS